MLLCHPEIAYNHSIMKEGKITEEYLEAIWVLLEKSGGAAGELDESRLAEYVGSSFSGAIVQGLVEEGKITLHARGIAHAIANGIILTAEGLSKSRQLIRAHRLAERLLHDVLGIENYEVGACEFEHIIDSNLIDGICTLLGHPRRSPDGLPIPEGECCQRHFENQPAPTVPVSRMRTGDMGRVASVNADDDTRLHVLENLQVRPGARLRVHQVSPTIVIECEGSIVAVDEVIAEHIHVWLQKMPAGASIGRAGRSVGKGSKSGRLPEHHGLRRLGRRRKEQI